MKTKDLKPGLIVAAKDYDGRYERAEVLVLGTPGTPDSPKYHTVEFQTGSYKGKKRNLPARQIRCEWNEYESEWWILRQEEFQHELSLAQQAYDKSEAIDVLETIRSAMQTVGIDAGIGQVAQRKTNGAMEQTMALFLPTKEAEKLLPVITDHSFKKLIS